MRLFYLCQCIFWFSDVCTQAYVGLVKFGIYELLHSSTKVSSFQQGWKYELINSAVTCILMETNCLLQIPLLKNSFLSDFIWKVYRWWIFLVYSQIKWERNKIVCIKSHNIPKTWETLDKGSETSIMSQISLNSQLT